MAGSGPVGVGFIGTGMISDTYLDNLTSFPDVRVLILGDLDQDRARSQAEKHGVAAMGLQQPTCWRIRTSRSWST